MKHTRDGLHHFHWPALFTTSAITILCYHPIAVRYKGESANGREKTADYGGRPIRNAGIVRTRFLLFDGRGYQGLSKRIALALMTAVSNRFDYHILLLVHSKTFANSLEEVAERYGCGDYVHSEFEVSKAEEAGLYAAASAIIIPSRSLDEPMPKLVDITRTFVMRATPAALILSRPPKGESEELDGFLSFLQIMTQVVEQNPKYGHP